MHLWVIRIYIQQQLMKAICKFIIIGAVKQTDLCTYALVWNSI